jgi:hypothetical protein
VRFHRAAQRGLSGLAKLVKFMDYNNLEALLLFRVELCAASYFFDKFLHNNPIVIISLTRSHFNVVK